MAERAGNRPFIQYGKNYSDTIASARANPTQTFGGYAGPATAAPGSMPAPKGMMDRMTQRLGVGPYAPSAPVPQGSFAQYTEAELAAMELADSERVAGMDENEQRAYDMAGSGAGAYQSDLDSARRLTERGAGTFLDADMGAYMNPYIKNALDPAARELKQRVDTDIRNSKIQAAKSGAFGGSRATLLETETRRGGQQATKDLYKEGYATAFESAANRFDADRNAAARGAEQYRALGAQRQAQLQNDVNTLLTTGGLRRQLKQANLDFNYEQFQTARDWDVNNLRPLLAALATAPHTTTSTSEAKSSAMGNIIGLVATVAGAYFGGPAGAKAGAEATGLGQDAPIGAAPPGGGGTFSQGGQGPPEPGSATASNFRPGTVPIGQTFYGVPQAA